MEKILLYICETVTPVITPVHQLSLLSLELSTANTIPLFTLILHDLTTILCFAPAALHHHSKLTRTKPLFWSKLTPIITEKGPLRSRRHCRSPDTYGFWVAPVSWAWLLVKSPVPADSNREEANYILYIIYYSCLNKNRAKLRNRTVKKVSQQYSVSVYWVGDL